jgi:hypothetical protein
MAIKFNPLTGNFDFTGSGGGGGGSAFFAGEVATYADLPLDGTAALNSRWLVRSNSGTWPFSTYKQAGVYVRTATGGTDRDADYTLTDTSFHDVMSDDAFVLFDDGDATKNLKFQLSGITTGTVRTITVPDANITLDDATDTRDPNAHTHTAADIDSEEAGAGYVLTADGDGVASWEEAQGGVEIGTDAGQAQDAQRGVLTKGDFENLEIGFGDFALNYQRLVGEGGETAFRIQAIDEGDEETIVAEALLGTRGPDAYLQGASADFRIEQQGGGLANILMVETKLEDVTSSNGHFATITADGELTDNRTLTVPDASGTLALLETLPAGGSKTYATFTATDNQPPATAFATLDTRNSIAVLDFDDAATESAVFVGILPEAADVSSGLIVSLRWMATTATSGDVRWSVAWEKSNTDLDSDSFDTATAATATTNGTSGIVTVTNITCTNIDSLAAGDLFRLRVQRIGGDAADTMTGDAELVAVEVRSAA